MSSFLKRKKKSIQGQSLPPIPQQDDFDSLPPPPSSVLYMTPPSPPQGNIPEDDLPPPPPNIMSLPSSPPIPPRISRIPSLKVPPPQSSSLITNSKEPQLSGPNNLPPAPPPPPPPQGPIFEPRTERKPQTPKPPQRQTPLKAEQPICMPGLMDIQNARSMLGKKNSSIKHVERTSEKSKVFPTQNSNNSEIQKYEKSNVFPRHNLNRDQEENIQRRAGDGHLIPNKASTSSVSPGVKLPTSSPPCVPFKLPKPTNSALKPHHPPSKMVKPQKPTKDYRKPLQKPQTTDKSSTNRLQGNSLVRDSNKQNKDIDKNEAVYSKPLKPDIFHIPSIDDMDVPTTADWDAIEKEFGLFLEQFDSMEFRTEEEGQYYVLEDDRAPHKGILDEIDFSKIDQEMLCH